MRTLQAISWLVLKIVGCKMAHFLKNLIYYMPVPITSYWQSRTFFCKISHISFNIHSLCVFFLSDFCRRWCIRKESVTLFQMDFKNFHQMPPTLPWNANWKNHAFECSQKLTLWSCFDTLWSCRVNPILIFLFKKSLIDCWKRKTMKVLPLSKNVY